MSSCSGLPICLSAICLVPHQQTRPSLLPVLASHCHPSTRFRSPPAPAAQTSIESIEDFGNSDVSSNARVIQPNWPRFAVAREMADLDRRRKAMKKQRYLQNAVYLLEQYRLQNEAIRACLERQSQDQSESTQNTFCAKAA